MYVRLFVYVRSFVRLFFFHDLERCERFKTYRFHVFVEERMMMMMMMRMMMMMMI